MAAQSGKTRKKWFFWIGVALLSIAGLFVLVIVPVEISDPDPNGIEALVFFTFVLAVPGAALTWFGRSRHIQSFEVGHEIPEPTHEAAEAKATGMADSAARPWVLKHPVVVPACRRDRLHWNAAERGILAIDESGIAYVSMAESRVGRLIWRLESFVAAVVIGILTYCVWFDVWSDWQFAILLWSLAGGVVAVAIAAVLAVVFSRDMATRALEREQRVKAAGFRVDEAGDAEWYRWGEIESFSVEHGALSLELNLKLQKQPSRVYALKESDPVLEISSRVQCRARVEDALGVYGSGRTTPRNRDIRAQSP